MLWFSVVVGLPEGIMGFVSDSLERLFRIDPVPLSAPLPLDEVLGTRESDGTTLLELRELAPSVGMRS